MPATQKTNHSIPGTPATSGTPEAGIQVLKAAFTPDPDDAYAWWVICSNRIGVRGFRIETCTRHIQEINDACVQNQEFDIAAISSAAYPHLSANYAILSAGASVGRGYGPALASKRLLTDAELTRGVRVGIPGELTTGALVLKLFYPHVSTVSLPFDQVAPAILRDELDAGVLIHEELLNWQACGLRKLACLGEKWTGSTGLPLPVGLNVVRRALGIDLMRRISAAVRESMLAARRYSAEAGAFAMSFSREAEPEIGSRFIGMFANDDTVKLDGDCIAALRELFRQAHARGLIDSMPAIETI